MNGESKRVVLGVEYDGTPWQGWQTQLHGLTVQDQLEAALLKFAQQPISTTCAGRTDTGVHALAQVVHFDTTLVREATSWVRGVNTFLPTSIAVRWAREVPFNAAEEFHARFSAHGRTYQYLLHNHPVRSPLLHGRAGWVFRKLSIETMREAAAYLIGEHDFSAFRSVQCQARTPVKLMREITLEQRGDLILITLHANAFLHHMVRNIVGSLIAVGNGSQAIGWMKDVLDSRERKLAAPTFMPDGLYLAKIDYDPKWCLPSEDMRNHLWHR